MNTLMWNLDRFRTAEPVEDRQGIFVENAKDLEIVGIIKRMRSLMVQEDDPFGWALTER